MQVEQALNKFSLKNCVVRLLNLKMALAPGKRWRPLVVFDDGAPTNTAHIITDPAEEKEHELGPELAAKHQEVAELKAKAVADGLRIAELEAENRRLLQELAAASEALSPL